MGGAVARRKRKSLRVSTISRAPSASERTAYRTLVAKLASRRSAMNLSQNDLDVVLGVAIGQVAKWEAFDRIPGAFLFACWCSALELRLEPVEIKRSA